MDDRHPIGLPRALLAYSISLAVFLLVPPTLKGTIGAPAAFTGQELMDVFTPVVVLPLAWLVLDAAGGSDRTTMLAFVAIAGLWAGAQGIHLAANAIGDAFPAGPARDAFYATDAGDLDHFLDEDLGHWAWHVAWALLSVLFLTRALRAGTWRLAVERVVTTLAAVLHGATFAIVSTEGGTAGLGIVLSVVLLAPSVLLGRRSAHPLTRFLAVSAVTTLLLYGAWAALNGGRLVEPCHVIGC